MNAAISVVVPVYGCAACLEDLVDRINATLGKRSQSHEILLVDDNSPDGAWIRIQELSVSHPYVRGLRLSRNFGQHAAITAGLAHSTGELVVVMDCDLQDQPEEIATLLDAMDHDNEIVLAQRIERQDGWLKRKGSQAFYRMLGWLTDSTYDHSTANFGVYSRKVVDTLNRMPESDRFLPLLARWTGFRTKMVPVSHASRLQGKSSYTLGTLLQMAMRVALSFSDKPLRLVMTLAFILASIGVAISVFAIYRYAIGDVRVAGFTSIMASIWLVGSMTMACVGVLGLYVGRLYGHVKQRPIYIIWQDTRHRQ